MIKSEIISYFSKNNYDCISEIKNKRIKNIIKKHITKNKKVIDFGVFYKIKENDKI